MAIFAVKLRESFKAYLSGKDEWATSCYSELLLDTLFEDTDAAEVKELEGWYTSKCGSRTGLFCLVQKSPLMINSFFFQNMMSLAARTEATWNP